MVAHEQAFEHILERSLLRLEAGESMSSILLDVPEYSTTLEPLLQTALELKQWNPPCLSARAREAGRARALYSFRSSIARAEHDVGYILGILQFDSAQRAPRLGVRRGWAGTRQLVFGAGDYGVDLRLNQDETTWTITGQVLGLCEGGYVELRDTGGVTQTKFEEMAAFTLPHVLPGTCILTLYLDQVVVKLPPLEVGS